MPDSGQWRNLERIIKAQFPTARITSTYRPGAVTAGSGNTSHHARGNAIDIAGPMMQIFEWLIANYPGSDEIIYSPGGSRQVYKGRPHTYTGITRVNHFDHVHWAAVDLTSAARGSGAPTIVNANNPVTDAIGAVTGISAAIEFFTNPGMWARVGLAIGGGLLLLMGLARLAGQSLTNTLPIGRAASIIRKVR